MTKRKHVQVTTATTMTRYKRRIGAKDFSGSTGNQERARRMRQRLNQLQNIVRRYRPDSKETINALAEIEMILRQFDKPLPHLPKLTLIDEAAEISPEAWETLKNGLGTCVGLEGEDRTAFRDSLLDVSHAWQNMGVEDAS